MFSLELVFSSTILFIYSNTLNKITCDYSKQNTCDVILIILINYNEHVSATTSKISLWFQLVAVINSAVQ